MSPTQKTFVISTRVLFTFFSIDLERDLRLSRDGFSLSLEFVATEVAQGYPGIAFGGFTASILDLGNIIAMRYADERQKYALNAHFDIQLRAPLALGRAYRLVANMQEVIPGRKLKVRSEIRDGEGKVCAESVSLVIIK